ncbi:hypothetical protein SSBR45G_23090 [Bradyrhizobium sp. SSBR45G]|nr:hypothetical protein SSBR45G_23090 [Bradyrhizobium sp. SSBR45G]GLH84493.1 hypothetical protein SSBR45R_19530 [Bradyrhizobium sp. SSBR45R]
MNRALLGEVSASLREVQYSFSDGNIDIFCVFDGEISEDDRESMSCVATEVTADFPNVTVQEHCLRIDVPDPVPNLPGRVTVFARKE